MRFNVEIFFPLGVAVIATILASHRGRSMPGWFVMGLFFNIFAVILLLVLPDLGVEETRDASMRMENRRLREKIRKERQVADQRHVAVEGRLRAHDRALGVDTAGRLPPSLNPELLASTPQASIEELRALDWWFVQQGEKVGPVPWDHLEEAWLDGAIGPESYVWNPRQTEWKRVRDLQGLERTLRA